MIYCFGCNQPYQNNKSLTLHLNQSIYCSASLDQHIPEASNNANSLHDDVNLRLVNVNAIDTNDLEVDHASNTNKDEGTISSQGSCTGTNNEYSETEAVMEFDNCSPNNTSLLYSNNLCHEIKLLKIINQLGMPLYSYKAIMDWAHEVCASQSHFQTQHNTYQQAVKHFETMFHLQNCRPQILPVKLLGDNMELEVLVFNIPAMLESLFDDSDLNQYENLVINPNDRFAKYESPGGRLGEVNSGQWYQTAYMNCIKDADKDFLCPLILASDKTTLSDMGDLHVDAIFMTTSLFNYKVSFLFVVIP
jgi:hypothetical protein